MKQRNTPLLCLHMGPFGHLLALITHIWITSCTLLRTFPTIPWEELISVLCCSPPCKDRGWLILPTTVLVRILQWNCSELLCLWHFWSRIRCSGIFCWRQKSGRNQCDCLPPWNWEVLHGWRALVYTRSYQKEKKYYMWIKILHLDIKFHRIYKTCIVPIYRRCDVNICEYLCQIFLQTYETL